MKVRKVFRGRKYTECWRRKDVQIFQFLRCADY
jgi:hypothetical protein